MTNDWFTMDAKGEPVLIPGGIKGYIKYVQNQGGEKRSILWGPLKNVAITLVGNYKVSTIFLGLDHNWEPGGPPVLWETMAFVFDKGKRARETAVWMKKQGFSWSKEKSDGYDYSGEDSDRCSGSREQAHAMHKKMVRKIARREKISLKDVEIVLT